MAHAITLVDTLKRLLKARGVWDDILDRYFTEQAARAS